MKEETNKVLKNVEKKVHVALPPNSLGAEFYMTLPDFLAYVGLFSIGRFQMNLMSKDLDQKHLQQILALAEKTVNEFRRSFLKGTISDDDLEKRNRLLEERSKISKKGGEESMPFLSKEDGDLILRVGLKHKFTMNDFINNEDIQYYLDYFELDLLRFYFFLLYAYDSTYETCIDGTIMLDANSQILRGFTRMIDSNIKSKEGGTVLTNSHMSLTLKVGTKKIIIGNPAVIEFIRSKCDVPDKELANNPLTNVLDFATLATKGVTESYGATLTYFAEVFILLFSSQEQILKKRHNILTPTKEEYDFIAKLAYFTKITGDSVYRNDGADALRKNIERHKYYVYRNQNKYDVDILTNSQGTPISFYTAGFSQKRHP